MAQFVQLWAVYIPVIYNLSWRLYTDAFLFNEMDKGTDVNNAL